MTTNKRCKEILDRNLRDVGRILDHLSGASDPDRCQRAASSPDGLCWQHQRMADERAARYRRYLEYEERAAHARYMAHGRVQDGARADAMADALTHLSDDATGKA